MTLEEFIQHLQSYDDLSHDIIVTALEQPWCTKDTLLIALSRIVLKEEDFITISRWLLPKLSTPSFELWLSQYNMYRESLTHNIQNDKDFIHNHISFLKKIPTLHHLAHFNIEHGLPLNLDAHTLLQCIHALNAEEKKKLVTWYIHNPDSFEEFTRHEFFNTSFTVKIKDFIFDLLVHMAFCHLDKVLLLCNKPFFDNIPTSSLYRLLWIKKKMPSWTITDYRDLIEDNSAIYNRKQNPLLTFMRFLTHNKDTLLKLETISNLTFKSSNHPILNDVYCFLLHPEKLNEKMIRINRTYAYDYYEHAVLNRRPKTFRWVETLNDFILAFHGLKSESVQDFQSVLQVLGVNIRHCDLKTLHQYIDTIPVSNNQDIEELDLCI